MQINHIVIWLTTLCVLEAQRLQIRKLALRQAPGLLYGVELVWEQPVSCDRQEQAYFQWRPAATLHTASVSRSMQAQNSVLLI